MKPQAYEALQKAKALFRHPAEADDIPADATPVEPIRKPRVVLLPPNAPKFDAQSMKEEQKQMSQPKQIDKYVGMSTNEACAECIKMGISKPSEIAKITGKDVKQIYTSLWNIRKGNVKKFKKVTKQMPAPYSSKKESQKAQQVEVKKDWGEVSDDFDPRREPTAWEDAHHVVFKSRAEYDAEIERLNQRISDLLIEKQEQATIIKYLERKSNV